MSTVGGQTKFCPERCASILRDLGKGNTRACAAERAGVCERTLRMWLAAGRKKDAEPGLVAFVAAVKKAERDAERRMVGVIRSTARKNWTAAAWWLERKFPESWRADSEMIRELLAELRKRRARG